MQRYLLHRSDQSTNAAVGRDHFLPGLKVGYRDHARIQEDSERSASPCLHRHAAWVSTHLVHNCTRVVAPPARWRGGAKEAERNIAKQSRETVTSSKMGKKREGEKNERERKIATPLGRTMQHTDAFGRLR
ncbi:MAG: hypothetical protein ACPIOQ_16155 [Promethearchaeia archaeon]